MVVGVALFAFLLPAGCLAAVFTWARWLHRKAVAPRAIRYAAFALIALSSLVCVANAIDLVRAVIEAGYADLYVPQQNDSHFASAKAQILGRAIAESIFNAVFTVAAVALPASLLLVATWRHHWFPRRDVTPREPPYR